jgi:hypothetical protein
MVVQRLTRKHTDTVLQKHFFLIFLTSYIVILTILNVHKVIFYLILRGKEQAGIFIGFPLFVNANICQLAKRGKNIKYQI